MPRISPLSWKELGKIFLAYRYIYRLVVAGAYQYKTGENRRKTSPVLPIVLYNGERPWNAPLNVDELTAPIHSKLAKFQLKQEYFLLDENRISQCLLDNAKGEAGYIFRFERTKDKEYVMALCNEFKNRLSDEKYEILRRTVRAWLINLMRRNNLVGQSSVDEPEEDNVMLEQKFRQWEQEFIQQGRAEGREEGLHTQKTTLIEMLSKRFGNLPSGWLETINSMTNPIIISQLTVAILSVNTPEEFDRLLQQPRF